MEATLSRSEFEIVERIALGESKKEVAYKTHRSIYTVETTMKNAYAKLGFSKLSDLVLWYCGKTFDISFQISERKRQVLASMILILIVVDLSLNPTDFCRIRRSRSRRKSETELFVEN
jgi:DNA-binding CsgD family transcriptional regulator